MGLAGKSMLFALFGLVMSIVTIIKIPVWKIKGAAGTGIVKELIGVNVIYKDRKETKVESKEYAYVLEINCNGTLYESEYREKVRGNKESAVSPGTQIDLYWDAKAKEYLNYTQAKKELVYYPLLFVAGCVLLAVSYLFFSISQ